MSAWYLNNCLKYEANHAYLLVHAWSQSCLHETCSTFKLWHHHQVHQSEYKANHIVQYAQTQSHRIATGLQNQCHWFAKTSKNSKKSPYTHTYIHTYTYTYFWIFVFPWKLCRHRVSPRGASICVCDSIVVDGVLISAMGWRKLFQPSNGCVCVNIHICECMYACM